MTAYDTDFVALGGGKPPTTTGFLSTGENNVEVGGLFYGSSLGAQGSGDPNGGHFGLVGTVGDGPDWFPAHGSGGVGVFGTSKAGPGVAGTSSLDAGVVGQSGDVFVVSGTAGVVGSSQSFPGVSGVSSTGNGVVGRSDTNFGVVGHSSKSTAVVGISGEEFGIVGGPATGVLGICIQPGPQFSDAPAGVIGTSATNAGVIGTSTQSWGVIGQSGPAAPVNPSFLNAAVLGTSTNALGVGGISANSLGVFAISLNNFGAVALSVQGGPVAGVPFTFPAAMLATSAKGTAVVGTSFESDGVVGFSQNSVGVFGNSGSLGPVVPNTSNIASVVGSSNQHHGVIGTSKASVGVIGFSNSIGVLGFATGPGALAGQFIGDLQVTGTKAAVVPFPDGTHRALYCMESPELWFEDFGSARLNHGRATVKLDEDFAKVVTLNGYRVFLTPEGDCKGLYVRSKRGGSFEVGELQGGSSNVAFSYRIVAKRKDVKRHTRFAKIDTPVLMPVGKARAARQRKLAQLPAATRALFAALEKETRKKAT